MPLVCAVLIAALLVQPAAAVRGQSAQVADLAAALEPYRAAQQEAALGTLTGRVYMEPRKPTAPAQGLAGTAVVVVPRSHEVLARLEEIKQRARDNVAAYAASGPAITDVRASYERRLWEAGAADFVRALVVNPDGSFVVDALPAGPWLVIAYRRLFVKKPSPDIGAHDRSLFVTRPRMVGYHAVTVWLREVAIEAGRSQTVELMDRNVWMTAIEEERVLDAPRSR